MAEIYIRTDPTTKVVTFVHRRPFDPINGLGATREELLKTGFFVTDFPSPNTSPGLRAVPYYDHETKKIYFEYEALPFSEKTRLNMLEDVVIGILTRFPEMCNVNTSSVNPMKMLMSMNRTYDDTPDFTTRGNDIMSKFPEFLAYQIHLDKMDRNEVFELYPNLKDEIQSFLDEWDIIPTIPDGDPEDVE